MELLLRRFVAGVPVLCFVALVGCDHGGVPTAAAPAIDAEQAGPQYTEASDGPDLSPLALYEAALELEIGLAKKWIGPEGGRLDFEGFAIDVPAGAVQRVTQFSIRLPVDPGRAAYVLAEFGPHGEFHEPVTIELPYAGTTLAGSETATVGWWNPDLEQWEDMGGEITSDGQGIRTSTPHFSEFGTMESRGDGVIMSGG